MSTAKRNGWSLMIAVAAIAAGTRLWSAIPGAGIETPADRYIVRAGSAAAAAELVAEVGGRAVRELTIIDAVAAELTVSEIAELRRADGIRRIWKDHGVEVSGNSNAGNNHPYTEYPAVVDADALHAEGITGRGVTVAVLDTGNSDFKGVLRNSENRYRLLAHYDAILGQPTWDTESDGSGHGTHVSSIVLNSADDSADRFNGLAPDADLVVVKALDDDGRGTYADVIAGLDWLLAHKDVYGIRVLNLSISGEVRSHYWDDPLNQAVMRLWQAGIAVVASAGNAGPDPMTVGVPGNVPYVITVGAMTDGGTPGDASDDRLASFSAAGPSYEAFLKPEVVAPGGHMLGLMAESDRIPQEHPEFYDHQGSYFTMSGTSQAAAVVSGIAALMLQADPALNPDDLKCRLLASARPAVEEDGSPTYSVFQQGAGLVNAYDAAFGTATGCANGGLDVAKDLGGLEHYAGPARQAEDGSFYVDGREDLVWDGAYLWDTTRLWEAAYLWDTRHYLWNDAYLWDTDATWDTAVWPEAYLWDTGLTEPMAINLWVEQE